MIPRAVSRCLLFRKAWLYVLLLAPASLCAQTWTWQHETIEAIPVRFPSVAVDSAGNVHVSYGAEGVGVKYAFRPADDKRWFTMTVEAGASGYTQIVLDRQDHPHKFFSPQNMKYAYWNGKKWIIQHIAPNTGPIWFSCSVGIAEDGTPHVAWYQEKMVDMSNFLHFKYAVIQDGAWMVRTLDFEPQTGKWLSLAVDSAGNPHISYDSFVVGSMKYTFFDGKQWATRILDSRSQKAYNVGMGSSIRLDSKGRAHISYHDTGSVRYAHEEDSNFKVETVASYQSKGGWQGWHTGLVLDSRGFAHITYDDDGALKHAYWDGAHWRQQVIAAAGSDPYRYAAVTIDKNDVLYVVYRDAADGTLQMATGRPEAATPARAQTQPPTPK